MAEGINTKITYTFSATDQASAVIRNVTKNFENLKSASEHMEQLKVVGTNTAQVKVQMTELGKSTKQTSNAMSNLFKGFATTILKVISIRKAISFAVDSLKQSSDWIENLHMFEIAFGDASKEAFAFSMNISKAFGVSSNEVIRYTSLFNQMAQAIGVANESAETMSYALTALGYDIASLYNISTETAMEKLRSGVAGQTKPLRQLGMDITAQTLDSFLKENLGVTNILSKMLNQSDKMLLRTLVILHQAKNAYGDMAETINTFANQVRVLQGSMDNFKLAIGDLVKEYAAPIISALAGFVIALTAVIRAFVPLQKATGIENIANSLSNVNSELDDTIEKAGLLSFDKFEALTRNGGTGFLDLSSFLGGQLSEEYAEYMTGFNEAMATIDNNANNIALSIAKWLDPAAKFNEETGEIEFNMDNLRGTIGKIIDVSKTLLVVFTGLFSVKLINGIISFVSNLKMALATIKATTLATTALTFSFAVLSMGVMTLMLNWGQMTDGQRIVSIFGAIAAAVMAAATAIMVFHTSWTMGLAIAGITAGIWLAVSSMAAVNKNIKEMSVDYRADGGYPDKGTMFWAGESGAEIVANVGGGKSGVANIPQIEEAVYRGTIRALSDTSGGTTKNNNVTLNINGKEFARATVNDMVGEIRRQNYKL